MTPRNDLHTRTELHTTPSVEVSVDLDVPLDRILAALEDPELLSAWLGEWHDGEHTTVRTDDGVRRVVTDRRWHDHAAGRELRWTWRHDGEPDGQGASHVAIEVLPTDGGTTRLVVRETLAAPAPGLPRASMRAGAAAPLLESAVWLAGLLALGAVLAASSLARV
jgi:uncharacterized protein YndB with AHSA1/START domain